MPCHVNGFYFVGEGGADGTRYGCYYSETHEGIKSELLAKRDFGVPEEDERKEGEEDIG